MKFEEKKSFREIFKEPGIAEPLEETVAREREFKDGFLNVHKTQNTQQYEEFFCRLDFEVLKSIIADFAARHGVNESNLNFLGSDRVFSLENTMKGGEYLAEANAIILDEPQSEKRIALSASDIERMEREILDAYGSWDIFRLKLLVHEEIHAISRIECVGMVAPDGSSRNDAKFLQIGFHQKYNALPSEGYYRPEFHEEWASHFFNALNEAVTERVSRNIVSVYLDQTGFADATALTYQRTLRDNPHKLKHYQEEIELVEKIIKQTAKHENTDEEKIWLQLENGLLHGERFEEGELRDLFQATFGGEFIKDLAWLFPKHMMGRKALGDFERKYELY